MPSAKKRRARRSSKLKAIPAISSHGLNIAAVANNPFDWRSRNSQIQKPGFRKTSISDILGNKLLESKSKDTFAAVNSVPFGYRSFRDHLVTNLQHMSSGRKETIHENNNSECNMNDGGKNNNLNLIDQQSQIQREEISITNNYYSSTPNAKRSFSDPSIANNSRFHENNQQVGQVTCTTADQTYKGNSSCIGNHGNTADKSNHAIDNGRVIHQDVNEDDSQISDKSVSVDNEQFKRKRKCTVSYNDRDTYSTPYIHSESKSYVSRLKYGGKREETTIAQFDIISELNERRREVDHFVCCEKAKQTENQSRKLISITVEIPSNFDVGSKVSDCQLVNAQRTEETMEKRAQSELRQSVDSKLARKYSLC